MIHTTGRRERMAVSSWCWPERLVRDPLRRAALAGAILALLGLALLPATPAVAGQASTGKLLFYPCTDCHPVTVDKVTGKPSHPIPIDFKGHGIVLEGHDVLGKDEAACLVCHDDSEHNPGLLHAVDGTPIDVKTGDIARLCQKCHFEKYNQFKEGTHGKHLPSCVAAGCHDPHTPEYIYVGPLTPFLGTGFQIKAVGRDRVPFRPIMPPPLQPPTVTPLWYQIVAGIGLLLVLAIAVGLARPAVMERLKR
jgi:hypothetical protein